MEVPPKNQRTEIPFDPGIPLLGIYPKNAGAQFERDRCTPMLIAALFTTAKKWKQPKCPSGDEWIKKRRYTHTHTHTHTVEYHSAIRRKPIPPPFATTRMELEGVMLSEISQVRWRKPGTQGFRSSVRYENKARTGRNKTAGRLTEPRSGLTVTKGKGTSPRMGGKGGMRKGVKGALRSAHRM